MRKLVWVPVLLGACGNPEAPAKQAPSGGLDLRAVCGRMMSLRESGCAFVAAVQDLDGCVADLERSHAEVPASVWIAQCFLDHATCDEVRACLDPPMP